jgi:ParB family chromosome partitioning protein
MESKKRRLGRGLEALLGPNSVTEARTSGELKTIKLKDIQPNPFQPRHVFDPDALEELKQSLKTNGLLQPVVLRPVDNGYELIAGERRFRAAGQLGWKEINAVIRSVDDQTLLTLALVENLQRDSLSPIDEALGYERLVNDFEVTQTDVADMVGRNRSTVANAIRLLRLPDDIQELIHSGKLSTGHARALLQTTDTRAMKALASRAVEDDLSVRELESLARGKRPPKRRPRGTPAADRDAELVRVEDALRKRLGTDVFVSRRGAGSGKVTINYYSNDDLARMLELVLGHPFDG